MGARISFVKTLSVLKDCLSDQALIDKTPSDVTHNLRAAMLRQGLAVLTFSAMEEFIRERTGEVLLELGGQGLKFSDFSVALQTATTIGALEGVRFRLKLQSQTDKISWLSTAVSSIAKRSALKDITELSKYSFGYAASNLDEEDVNKILKAFGVDAPWEQMTHLANRIGLVLLSPKTEFESIKRRRHSSAHALNSIVPYGDLLDSLKSTLAICLTFDLLLSHCRAMSNLRRVPGMAGLPKVAQSDVKLVFIRRRIGRSDFEVRNEQLPNPNPILKRPTIRVFPSEALAIGYGVKYASARKMQLIVTDATSIPTAWVLW